MPETDVQPGRRPFGTIPRIYVDTSVIGGCLDEEFAVASRGLLDMARAGDIVLLTSDILLEELGRAPEAVQALLESLPPESTELLSSNSETLRLRDAYLAARTVGPVSETDAHHVAIATVFRADLIVSWNFKHIVRVQRIRAFNAVNLAEGYNLVDIRSPLEVV